jgi:hypothetical protein
LFVAVQFLRPGPAPIAAPLSPSQQIIAALHTAMPGEGQAAVVRLRLPPDVQLQQVLAAAGFLTQAAAANTGAEEIGAAYQKQLRQRVGEQFDAATIAATEALFIEAPLTNLEKALLTLTSDPARRCELRSEARLTFAGVRRKSDGAEAEGNTASPQLLARGPYVQQLAAGIYRLERQVTPATVEAASQSIDAQRPVRVLILIERIDGR